MRLGASACSLRIVTSAAVSTAGLASKPHAAAGSVSGFGQLLVTQIPSEALIGYTTLLAVFSAGHGSYQAGRWALYAVSLPACAAVVISPYLVNGTTTSRAIKVATVRP